MSTITAHHSHELAASRGWLPGRLRPLLTVLRPYRRLLITTIASGIAHQALMIASAVLAAYLVGRAVTGAPVGDVWIGVLVLVALVIPQVAMPWLETVLAHVMAFRTLVDLRHGIYDAFERLAPGYLLERRSGDLGATAIADVEKVEVFFAHTLSPLIVALVVPTVAAVALAIFHWLLVIAVLPFLILVATVPAWLQRRAERQGVELRERLGEVSAEVVDLVQGLREVVAFGQGPRHLDELGRTTGALRAVQVAHGARAGFERAATEVLVTLGMLSVLATAAFLVSHHALTASLFPPAMILAAIAFVPITLLTDVARELNVVAASGERIFALYKEPAPVVERVRSAPAQPINPPVSFEAVSFRYSPWLPHAVTGVTFAIAPRESVALVGHSGAGKSTCASLLLRFWDVADGSIRIGGHDLRDLSLETLHNLVGFVSQDVYLFHGSVADNIRLGKPEATDAEVHAAAASARADEFIEGLPEGYQTFVGERGAQLSGGQRQRIAIARALLKDAPMLVLDEAVSSLDAESERELEVAMARARSGRTTLVIAHRLSTIRAADRVVVLRAGQVVQVGRHQELMAEDGEYRRLLASQQGAVA